jgi:hypothetical protein
VEQVLAKGRIGTSGSGEVLGKGGRYGGKYNAKTVYVYVNAKIIPAETIAGIGVNRG